MKDLCIINNQQNQGWTDTSAVVLLLGSGILLVFDVPAPLHLAVGTVVWAGTVVGIVVWVGTVVGIVVWAGTVVGIVVEPEIVALAETVVAETAVVTESAAEV